MAYSEYGGVGFRDGVRVDAASDAVVTPDLDNVGTPGCWPGFGEHAGRIGEAAFDELLGRSVSAHVVLGDGPVLVALHKQSTITLHVLEAGAFTEIDLGAVAVDLPDEVQCDWGDGEFHLDDDAMVREGAIVRFEFEGHVVKYALRRDANLVQHARLTLPDGTVWSGFSGHEIGAGHDDDDTADEIVRHLAVFES